MPAARPDLVHLRLLATSDVHGWLAPWDYHAAQPLPDAGLARTARLIDEARAASDTLLFDNGDFLQGNPLSDRRMAEGEAHPVIAAMNQLNYDAVTLGNHEFNFGLPALREALDAARFPVVSANISDMKGGEIVPRSVVLVRPVTDGAGGRHDLRVGVIGFLPVQVMIWDRAHLEGRVTVEPILAAARAQIGALRARCDLVVALCHAGIGAPTVACDSEDASTALAGLEGIDVVVTGHSHLVFPSARFEGMEGVDARRGTLQGKPAVMPGSRGSHLGVIDLQMRVGDWRIVSSSSHAVPVAHVPAAPAVVQTVAAAHEATLREIERPLGHTDRPLNSFFAMVAPSPAASLIAEASAAHIRNQLETDEVPVLGTGQPFRCGGRGGPRHYTDIPAGPLTLRHASDIYSYPNTVAALRLTGGDVHRWLERAARVFRRLRPGAEDQPLLDPEVPSYNFDLIHGLSFVVDLERPAMFAADGRVVGDGRIRELTYKGKPLDPEAEFIVATSSYRAGGAGGFAPHPPMYAGTRRMRDVLSDHLARRPVPPTAPFWSFAPMPGTTAVFPTSPRAADHLDEVPHLSLTPLAEDDAGFLTLRLSL
ncbi:bifunctional 2',3'-cyclic-nucleotide 2'-phosphodiesterase/3'-nucleotidase [Falsirhodobacter sp. 20TX0035]|uniref:bifunctional 2',3'-cyclic-nucleotide 2'-phosphodiesterase/3'-nucleotidase n=1 Tax=Falsirhodobacter sp. 20TX0035 TaxID=3022019 RepID=UPI0023305AAC|nr:bifunctional 2',3'-cyclic-nucleotide 2'-phosphodiesterase/3'-nucleotidase [Falsirhodobacter sp. 20TX0035]MDB6452336.1 bifunctional 2',3'-cyclic-nucleotide 2'-phosphodiesterase/3'-nucleotidase [Falsirhodobacter sp. 20TX0035]